MTVRSFIHRQNVCFSFFILITCEKNRHLRPRVSSTQHLFLFSLDKASHMQPTLRDNCLPHQTQFQLFILLQLSTKFVLLNVCVWVCVRKPHSPGRWQQSVNERVWPPASALSRAGSAAAAAALLSLLAAPFSESEWGIAIFHRASYQQPNSTSSTKAFVWTG